MKDLGRPTIELELCLHKASAGPSGGYLLSVDGERGGAVWVPKSRISGVDYVRSTVAGPVNKYTLDAAYAAEKGLAGAPRAAGVDDMFGGDV